MTDRNRWEGLLVVDKPAGLTSHDVVARLRRLSGQRRVGHAGTLDPLATGVLLLCLGRATRLIEYLVAQPKTYETRIRLGQTTDSYDADGALLEDRPVHVEPPALEAALVPFRGPIAQIPPMFSALKRDGQPLYKLARKGQVVEREPRPRDHLRADAAGLGAPPISTCASPVPPAPTSAPWPTIWARPWAAAAT